MSFVDERRGDRGNCPTTNYRGYPSLPYGSAPCGKGERGHAENECCDPADHVGSKCRSERSRLLAAAVIGFNLPLTNGSFCAVLDELSGSERTRVRKGPSPTNLHDRFGWTVARWLQRPTDFLISSPFGCAHVRAGSSYPYRGRYDSNHFSERQMGMTEKLAALGVRTTQATPIHQ